MKLKLSQKSRDNIKQNTGLEISKISRMSAEELDDYLENRINKKLVFKMPLDDNRLIGRGSVLLYLRRLLNIDFINKKLSHI